MALKIRVASRNPVKIRAAEIAFEQVFPMHTFQCEGISVDSGVPDQPEGVEQTLNGAMNRVKGLRKSGEAADYFVGMEGGICYINKDCFAFAWMYVENQSGLVGKAMTGYFQLPPRVVSLLEEGMELGHANDQIYGRQNSKQKGGAVGLLTDNMLDRTSYYVHAMILALIPFKNQKLFKTQENEFEE